MDPTCPVILLLFLSCVFISPIYMPKILFFYLLTCLAPCPVPFFFFFFFNLSLPISFSCDWLFIFSPNCDSKYAYFLESSVSYISNYKVSLFSCLVMASLPSCTAPVFPLFLLRLCYFRLFHDSLSFGPSQGWWC